MGSAVLERAEIDTSLAALAGELERRGVRAQIFVVGGAAMVIAFNARKATRDVDAVFVPVGEVQEAARVVARRRGLPPDWINDAVRSYLPPGEDPAPRPVIEMGSVQIATASAEYLLAMKVLAARDPQDRGDIELLSSILGVESAEQAVSVYERFYPGHRLPDRSRLLLDDIF